MAYFDVCGPAVELRPAVAQSPFPADAHALIYPLSPSVTMSPRKLAAVWKLGFERRSPLRIEPLMGWTEDDDPLAQVSLFFPSAQAAITYARRSGVPYTVLGPSTSPMAENGVRAHGTGRHCGPSQPGTTEFAATGRTRTGEACLNRPGS